MVIINCKGINTDDPLTAAGSKFYHWFNAGLRGIAFSSRRSSRWGTFSHRWHSLNRPGGATENYRWLVSTFITMGPYIITKGEAINGYAISFHSPIMSAFFHSKNAPSILYTTSPLPIWHTYFFIGKPLVIGTYSISQSGLTIWYCHLTWFLGCSVHVTLHCALRNGLWLARYTKGKVINWFFERIIMSITFP
jgi:hypothetical protein